ncbi:MAG: ATP-binding cassette domain-containing protein, partial [Erysipelotrichales bacterium]|nr:ATP-binding cassette domain-containing protein [Erysipelotrichales bacterium]
EALKDVGLKGFEKKRIFELSGGEQQRVAMARLLVKPCEIVLADEPTGNVDSNNKQAIMNLFQMIRERGKTVLVVTHDESLKKYFDYSLYIQGK